MYSNIYLFHMFVVAPFLFYIAYNREDANSLAFDVLLMVSLGVFGYHSMRYYKLNQLNKS